VVGTRSKQGRHSACWAQAEWRLLLGNQAIC